MSPKQFNPVAGIGGDSLFEFGADRYRVQSATYRALNLANQYALYNFLSTFSHTS